MPAFGFFLTGPAALQPSGGAERSESLYVNRKRSERRIQRGKKRPP